MKNSLDSIIIEAEARENAVFSGTPVSRRKFILKPAMIFVIFVVISIFSFTGTLFASQDSLPGETLYPLKRSFEEFKLNIYPENLKGGLHLRFLKNRIDEAEIILAMQNNIDPLLVEELISEIDRQYGSCIQYGCIDPDSEDDILESINSVKNRYQNRFKEDSGINSNGTNKDTEQNNNNRDNNMNQKQGKNSRGNGN